MNGLLVICAVVLGFCYNLVSGSLISLKFVEDYMRLSGLKDPMFILKSRDLDEFFLQIQERPFNSITCLCYDESELDLYIYIYIYISKFNLSPC